MGPITTLARKEFRDLFSSAVAYVFIAVFLFLCFWMSFGDIALMNETTMRPFFSWATVLFIVFLPSVTMGRWADEHKSGTLELLLTLPVTDAQLIVGKFLAVAAFLLLILGFTLPLAGALAWLGDLDAGQVAASYFGLFLLGAAYVAFGLFVSSLTRSPIVAFLTTVLALFFFYVIGEPVVTAYLPKSAVPIVQFLSFSTHFESLARGVIDSRDLVYLASVTGLFLYLNLISLNMRKV